MVHSGVHHPAQHTTGKPTKTRAAMDTPLNTITMPDSWAATLAEDIRAAGASVVLSALSMQPPRHNNGTPHSDLWQAIIAAPPRGVSATIYLPVPALAHPATLYNTSAAQAAHAHGVQVHFVPMPRLLHAKTAIIDGILVWIGSGNLTAAAAHHNHEAFCRFWSPEIAARLLMRWEQAARG